MADTFLRSGLLDFELEKKGLELFPIKNMPLQRIDWDAQVYPEDIEMDVEWPPRRCEGRFYRQNDLLDISTNHLSKYINVSNPFNRYSSLVDISKGILFTSMPKHNTITNIVQTIKLAYSNMSRYGRCIFINVGNKIIVPDTMYCWPLGLTSDGEEGWIIVTPVVGRDTVDNEYTQAVITVLEGGTMTQATRKIDSTQGVPKFKFQEITSSAEIIPARWTSASYGDISNGWGTSQVESIADLILAFVQMDAIVDHIISKNSNPILTVDQNKVDINTLIDKVGTANTEPTDTLTPDQLKKIAGSVRYNDIIFGGDGTSNLRFVEWGGNNIQAAFTRIDRLNHLWSMKTGQTMGEAGDNGNLESGVALARRQAGLTVRLRSVFNDITEAIEEIAPGLQWEFVDNLNNPTDGEEGDAGFNEGASAAGQRAER